MHRATLCARVCSAAHRGARVRACVAAVEERLRAVGLTSIARDERSLVGIDMASFDVLAMWLQYPHLKSGSSRPFMGTLPCENL